MPTVGEIRFQELVSSSAVKVERALVRIANALERIDRRMAMAATKKDIEQWYREGEQMKGVTHMIVACDTFDHDDYPVYVREGEDAKASVEKISAEPMQKVMEVYSYSKNAPVFPVQLAQHRAYYFD